MSESWWEYVNRVSTRASQVEIAKAARVDPATVSRWKLGKTIPSADSVIAVARHFRRNPVEALIAAGYLDKTEAGTPIELRQSATEISNDQLIELITTRLRAAPDPRNTDKPRGLKPANQGNDLDHPPVTGLPAAARTLPTEHQNPRPADGDHNHDA
ncbi:helix-turn-helix transcriptional regulator [Rhodococcus ruber]|uniref:helix-turn-helix domain-containing protein n=1 Tax=Rhodococcus ruber TaxID=1830 RepID=UPI00265B10FD|nr:helix-turn-helix transcriptional regulator [Rhodococcus ruber]WKK12000.1 helix-turn-helix transcriptional regulator [Rhodococcus ruber]